MTHMRHQALEWVWRGIRFRLPGSWEMLQFSTEHDRGRCAFADRRQFRTEISWSMVQGEPDYGRMVSGYMSKLQLEKKLSDPTPLKRCGWHGFEGRMFGLWTSRFGLYFKELGCLLEWVMIWPEGRDQDLEASILSNTAPAMAADGEGLVTWRAFGLDLRVPKEAAFEGATVQPARAEFSFIDPKSGNTWRFGRLGMVSAWHQGTIRDWLETSLHGFTRNVRFSSRTGPGGLEYVSADGEFKPEGIHLKWGSVSARAWIDPTDERLYWARRMIRRASPGSDVPVEKLLYAAPEFTTAARPEAAA